MLRYESFFIWSQVIFKGLFFIRKVTRESLRERGREQEGEREGAQQAEESWLSLLTRASSLPGSS